MLNKEKRYYESDGGVLICQEKLAVGRKEKQEKEKKSFFLIDLQRNKKEMHVVLD